MQVAYCFNEAAGFTQRKRATPEETVKALSLASMRPPVLPSGNMCFTAPGSGAP